MAPLDKELRERIDEPASEEAEREARLSPQDAVAKMRIKVPAQRSRKLRTILDKDLAHPMALQFNPHDGSLWIVNGWNDSSVIVVCSGCATARSGAATTAVVASSATTSATRRATTDGAPPPTSRRRCR